MGSSEFLSRSQLPLQYLFAVDMMIENNEAFEPSPDISEVRGTVREPECLAWRRRAQAGAEVPKKTSGKEVRCSFLRDRIEAQKHGAQQLSEFRRAAAEFEKRGDEAELDAIGKIYYQRDLLLKQAEHLKGVEADIAGIRKSADDQASVAFKKPRDGDYASTAQSPALLSIDCPRRAEAILHVA